MTIATAIVRPLGTMVAYGFATVDFAAELALARRIGASVLEVLPEWRTLPDPGVLRRQVADAGLTLHSAHGCWGGQAIRAPRVDLGELDAAAHRAAVADLKACVDWLAAAGGSFLVVHPGGLSEAAEAPARRAALARGLIALAEHARDTGVVLCVENMPPGVHPGSRMADLFDLLAELDRPELALALDTGHAHITAAAPPRPAPRDGSSGPPTSTTTTDARTPTFPPASALSTGPPGSKPSTPSTTAAPSSSSASATSAKIPAA